MQDTKEGHIRITNCDSRGEIECQEHFINARKLILDKLELEVRDGYLQPIAHRYMKDSELQEHSRIVHIKTHESRRIESPHNYKNKMSRHYRIIRECLLHMISCPYPNLHYLSYDKEQPVLINDEYKTKLTEMILDDITRGLEWNMDYPYYPYHDLIIYDPHDKHRHIVLNAYIQHETDVIMFAEKHQHQQIDDEDDIRTPLTPIYYEWNSFIQDVYQTACDSIPHKRRGDLIIFTEQREYRNEFVCVIDSKDDEYFVIKLDHETDEYGALPSIFLTPTQFPPQYFIGHIDHNRIIHPDFSLKWQLVRNKSPATDEGMGEFDLYLQDLCTFRTTHDSKEYWLMAPKSDINLENIVAVSSQLDQLLWSAFGYYQVIKSNNHYIKVGTYGSVINGRFVPYGTSKRRSNNKGAEPTYYRISYSYYHRPSIVYYNYTGDDLPDTAISITQKNIECYELDLTFDNVIVSKSDMHRCRNTSAIINRIGHLALPASVLSCRYCKDKLPEKYEDSKVS